MISVLLNGQPQQIVADMILSEAMLHWGYTKKHVAVAVNESFITRNEHDKTLLKNGDRIDVVSPMQGG